MTMNNGQYIMVKRLHLYPSLTTPVKIIILSQSNTNNFTMLSMKKSGVIITSENLLINNILDYLIKSSNVKSIRNSF